MIFFRNKKISSLFLLVMEKFKFKKTLENGLTNSLNSNISDTDIDIDIPLKENNVFFKTKQK